MTASWSCEDRAHRRALVSPRRGHAKTVTVSREADGWYVCCSCADVPMQPLPLTGEGTGIDVGLQGVAQHSRRRAGGDPPYYRKAERSLKNAPLRVSRRKKEARAR